MFLPFLVLTSFIICLMVKERSFCGSDGISLTLLNEKTQNEENFIQSCLFTSNSHCRFAYRRRKSIFFLLLSICGDVERCPGPQYSGLPDDINRFCRVKGIKMFNLNICGLDGNFDELKNILVNSKIDVFGLNEIFLSSEDDEKINNKIEICKHLLD